MKEKNFGNFFLVAKLKALQPPFGSRRDRLQQLMPYHRTLLK
jgi:hypothetical protein